MKKILISLMAIALVIGLVGAGTVAWFSDTETSTGNTFTAGTLDLKVDGANDPLPVKFTLTDLAPGSSGTITYVLANVGSIDGYVDIEGVTVVNAPGATPESEPTPDQSELGANLLVTVTLGTQTVYGPAALNGFAGNWDVSESLTAGSTINCVISWSIPDTVGNEIQGDIATVGMTFELAQTAAQ